MDVIEAILSQAVGIIFRGLCSSEQAVWKNGPCITIPKTYSMYGLQWRWLSSVNDPHGFHVTHADDNG